MSNESHTDCRSDSGITVGLIDALIAISRILKSRDLTNPDIQEALQDLQSDEDIKFILNSNTQSEHYPIIQKIESN